MHQDGGERGQTTIDFAIGASIFLIAVAFAFTFIPTLTQPFTTDGSPGTEIASERATSTITDLYLDADGVTRGTTELDSDCTVAFFENASEPGCEYDPAPLDEAVAMSVRNDGVYVAILNTNDASVATYDGTDLERPAGVTPPGGANVASTSRIVLLDGQYYRLLVRVW